MEGWESWQRLIDEMELVMRGKAHRSLDGRVVIDDQLDEGPEGESSSK